VSQRDKVLSVLRDGPLDDDQLAARLGVRRQQINQLCNKLSAEGLIDRGRGPHGKIVSAAKGSLPPSPPSLSAPQPIGDDEPWFWEGSVQATLADHLVAQGWRIVSQADTATQERGIDLEVSRDGTTLAIEVKGWPKTTYQRGPKKGQPKSTQPTLQAKHWFADAFFSLVRLHSKRPEIALAMALPDYPRYRSLLDGTRWAFAQLGFGLFLVREDGSVNAEVEARI
jgi:hypothetical protein